MGDSTKQTPAASVVGKQFIMHYYTVMHDEPENLHKFYKEESVFSSGTESEPTPPDYTVSGQTVMIALP